MAKVAVDFGTCNTVIARLNETTGAPETLPVPGITTTLRHVDGAGRREHAVHVVPSLIHYSSSETLIGDQVLGRGLAEHRDTLRWMKRGIAERRTQRRKTAQGHKSPAEAGAEFLSTVLRYAQDRLDFVQDEFTFTAPVEAFEDFQDWLMRVAESVGIRRVRLLDEPTACVLGYQGIVRSDDRYVVFDFGGGTLDVATVRVDLAADDQRKAFQLGQAGKDLGGMDVDQWIAEDFRTRHGLDGADYADLEAIVLRQAEAGKIALSSPDEDSVTLRVPRTVGSMTRLLSTTYTRCCPSCERGASGHHPDPDEACLGCLLVEHGFQRQVRETLQRALENAAVKAGVRRDDVSRVVVTGGTSLIPCVREILKESFDGRVEMSRPFDAVVRGACAGIVAPILQHDYAIESYSQERREYEFRPLLKTGTEYPTRPDAVRLWSKGSYDGQTRIGLKIFEVSRLRRRAGAGSLVDEKGVLRAESRVTTDFEHICLNTDNPTFIVADPPINKERDGQRFLTTFAVDGNRRLVVTVIDNMAGKTLLKEHPVVRL